ncbi:unnamed protein product [Cuscuta epithymum]|uniref:Uncharacterized protein n=1 Tax=Cuscuta epithymum TaxID=186058 RepID=A0AAV0DL66_9ASTE|nr:unnamed protein product [Cuscuta epithymum]
MDQDNFHYSSTDDHSKQHKTAALLAKLKRKKRKLESEQLGAPLPKQIRAYQNFLRKYGSLLDDDDDDIPQENEHEATTNTSESGECSNGITDDADYVTSYETNPCSSNSYAGMGYDWPNSSESGYVSTTPYSYADYLNYNNGVDCSSSGYVNERTEMSSGQHEHDDALFSHDASPNNFVLSSGRWEVGQQESEEKLTIDKEFEQYFGRLMLQ